MGWRKSGQQRAGASAHRGWLREQSFCGLRMLLLAWLLAGCLPSNATWRPGLGTRQITVVFPPRVMERVADQALVVVLRRLHTFIETAPGAPPLHRSEARIYTPDADGRVRIPLPLQVVAADLLFIAPGHLTEVFSWQRQLGLGEITYRVRTQPHNAWRAHFYTFLQPQLNPLLTEVRYGLNGAEQLLLSAWLQKQAALLNP